MNPNLIVFCSTPEEAAITDMAIGLTHLATIASEHQNTFGQRQQAFEFYTKADLEQFNANKKDIEDRLLSQHPWAMAQYNGDRQHKYHWVGTSH